ncbi:MAG TPA: hypothetical protein VGM19_12355 [Armatimonadota bacterium]|jgi:cellobionic acid phosphorylase
MTQLKSGFTPEGERYVVRDVHAFDRADAYLWNDDMYLKIDQRGRCECAFLQPNITPYAGGQRCFYVRDEATGEFWSVPYDPVKREPEEFEFSLGRGDLVWRNVTAGIEVRLEVVVPRDAFVELWTATVTNLGEQPRKLSLYSFLPVGPPWAMSRDGDWDDKLNGLNYHAFPYYVKVEDYYKLAALRNEAFVATDVKPTSWDMSIAEFEGLYGLHAPAGLQAKRLGKHTARNEEVAAIFQWAWTLAAGKSKTVKLVLGPAQDKREMQRLRDRFLAPGAFAAAKEKVYAFFAQHDSTVKVETPDADFNHYLNVWLPFQNLINGRALRFNKDACGRNIIQDSMGITYTDPATERELYLVTWSQQETDGWLPHSVKAHPDAVTSPINTIPHRDMNAWGPYSLYFYLTETGDMSILDEKLGFADSKEQATLYEHINRGLEWLLKDRSPRRLSHIGEGDWNDPLNMAGHQNKGESIWLTEALAHALDVWAEVADRVGDADRAIRYRKEAETCRKAVNKHAWDGAWYMRGTTDAGRRFGVKGDKEGTVFINSQSWAIISGAATGERVDQVMAAVDKYLMTPAGPMTVAPPFTHMYEDIGKLTLKHPGTGENGSVYCHAAAFLAYALYLARRGERAFEMHRTLLTGWGTNPLSRSGQVPTYIPNAFMGFGMDRYAGQSSHSPMTGTIAWWLRTSVTLLLGVRAEWEGLRLDPQLPAAWKHARVSKRFRGADYDIEIKRQKGVTGVKVVLDGVELADNLVPLQKKNSRHQVIVLIGV